MDLCNHCRRPRDVGDPIIELVDGVKVPSKTEADKCFVELHPQGVGNRFFCDYECLISFFIDPDTDGTDPLECAALEEMSEEAVVTIEEYVMENLDSIMPEPEVHLQGRR